MKNTIFYLMILFTVITLGCDNDDDSNINCTEVFVSGLKITLIDNISQDIVTENVEVITTDGNYQETLMNIEQSDYFIGAGERPGNYIITVTSSNYQTYVSEVINVSSDVCHVITESIEIHLTPN